MKRNKTALVFIYVILLVIGLGACKGIVGSDPELDPGHGVTPTALPEVVEPTIDGTIQDQEWQDAAVQHFSDGSDLYLMISGDHLFLAIRASGARMIAGNVFLAESGQVSILHTSAALGTARYQFEGDQYRKVKDFSWCCRSKVADEASQSARDEFYAQEGWLGVNSFLGAKNELEYMILLEGQPEKLAVNFIHAEGAEDKQVWPVGLEDGVALPSSGGFPDLIVFSVESWISLEDLQ